jgi:hypothetical protein
MADIYIAWVPVLLEDLAALRELKDSGLVTGIEMSRIHNNIDNIKKAGLRLSLHNPGVEAPPNLADPDLTSIFSGDAGARLLKAIQKSDTPCIGYHCGYAAEKIFKATAFPDIPHPDTLIHDRELLLSRMSANFAFLEHRINAELPVSKRKRLLLESMDYSRERSIDWSIQRYIPAEDRDLVEGILRQFGVNAAFRHITELDFIQEILDKSSAMMSLAPGYLFDIAHVFITADAKISEKKFTGTIGDFFEKHVQMLGDRTFQLHLNVPVGNDETGYADGHCFFSPGEPLSDFVMDLTKFVSKRCSNLDCINLEMGRARWRPDLYVKKIIRQVEYVVNELAL